MTVFLSCVWQTVRDTVVRALLTIDPEIVKTSSRSDWLPTVHNLCFLHASLRLRARYGRSGWNIPSDFLQFSNRELVVIILHYFTQFYQVEVACCVCAVFILKFVILVSISV